MLFRVALLVLIACKQAPGPAAVPAPHAGMALLLIDATSARDALIAGDLAKARRHLRAVAASPTPEGLPDGSTPSIEAVRAAAREGQAASDAPALGSAIAKMGASCGGCHLAFGAQPGFDAAAGTPPDETMPRHLWAADRMWEGLIAPNPERYRLGASSLLTEAADDEGLYAGMDPSAMRAASTLHKLVHANAELAAGLDHPAGRAELYGALIGACAECHGIAGGP